MKTIFAYSVALFDEVISEFGRVVTRVNRRFGTCFVPFEHTSADVKTCYDQIDQYILQSGGNHSLVLKSSRPVPERERLKKSMMEKIESREYHSLLLRANELFQRWTEFVVVEDGKSG